MALYSVHLKGSGLKAMTDAVFVRQAFDWKAFFWGPLWLAQHRLWLGLLLWAAAYLLLIGASQLLSGSHLFFMGLAVQILLGLEASRLREAKLAGLGYQLSDIIAAPALDAAEVAFFRRMEAPQAGLDEAVAPSGARA